MAALLREATISGADQWTPVVDFRGRVNVYVGPTSPAWKGWVHLQRRFKKASNEFVEWETIEAYNEPGSRTFVEHEDGVQYRLGVPAGAALVGGSPLVRISQ